MLRRWSASLWWRSLSAKLSAKPRASRAWSGGSERPGIGTRSDLPWIDGASEVQPTSASGSCPIARAAPVSACLKRSRGDSSAIAGGCYPKRHPGESRDLLRQRRTWRREIPAFAGMTLKRVARSERADQHRVACRARIGADRGFLAADLAPDRIVDDLREARRHAAEIDAGQSGDELADQRILR